MEQGLSTFIGFRDPLRASFLLNVKGMFSSNDLIHLFQ